MKSKIISATLVIIGFTLGASALSTLAAWSAPGCTPPNCNTPAPLHVATSSQSKVGPLQVNWNLVNPATIGLQLNGKIQIINSDVGAGRVLTDVLGDGVGTWVMPSGGGTAGSSASGMYKMETMGNNVPWTVPVGAKFAKVTVVGGGINDVASGSLGNCDAGGTVYGGLAQKIMPVTPGEIANLTIKTEQYSTTYGNYNGTTATFVLGSATVSATGSYMTTTNSCNNGLGTGGDISGSGPYLGVYGKFNPYAAAFGTPVIHIEWY